ncbi:unnamed protein product [Orchesella dallaii]|uniref:Eukaryotic translation initiation factor 2 subunit 2 n=1 Tax=Orchesella dallaii TaxID=48710 RepID=A0ABP1RA20_9HEXA
MADPAVGTNSEIFDPSKEKKKKKKKVLDLDSVLLGSSSAAVDEEVVAEPVGVIPDTVEFGDGEPGAHDDILESLETFGSKKKKKKVKKIVLDEDVAAVIEEEIGVGGEEALDFDFTKKKKKKGAKGIDDLVAGEELEDETGEVQFNEGESPEKENAEVVNIPAPKTWLTSDRDYTYDELLTRVFEIMHAKNPEMASGTKQKFVMRPPQVVRIGTKKTSFVNFMEICKMLHRHQKHLLDFLLSELGTSGSIDGNNQLIIKGRFQQKQIENVLRRYIKEYVTCHTCRSPNTLLQKDFRLFFLQCEACGSRCSVASIKHGFQAVTGKRAAMRAKAN